MKPKIRKELLVTSLELFQLKYKEAILQKGFHLVEETHKEAAHGTFERILHQFHK